MLKMNSQILRIEFIRFDDYHVCQTVLRYVLMKRDRKSKGGGQGFFKSS